MVEVSTEYLLGENRGLNCLQKEGRKVMKAETSG